LISHAIGALRRGFTGLTACIWRIRVNASRKEAAGSPLLNHLAAPTKTMKHLPPLIGSEFTLNKTNREGDGEKETKKRLTAAVKSYGKSGICLSPELSGAGAAERPHSAWPITDQVVGGRFFCILSPIRRMEGAHSSGRSGLCVT